MKKNITIQYGGKNAKVDQLLVNRLLPHSSFSSVGPFVFLDHIYPTVLAPEIPLPPNGSFAHPHRGIATFSYLLSGALEHFDSRGNHGIIESGGAQWMKAGNGILHDEQRSAAFQQQGGLFHGMQFWINLPAKNKAEASEYKAVQSKDIPETQLPDDAGTLRVIIGVCGVEQSPVKTYSRQFIYHVKLNPKSGFAMPTKADFEYAAFIPANEVKINDTLSGKSELLIFDRSDENIELYNPGITPADIILFGGEPYVEPMVSKGPFVMNTPTEIAQAYDDFFEGKYGRIEYPVN
ncbi:pirin family protein [Mucilaginibacter sp. PAMB04168]|uniref:pirin family protein n=1 Tax=Mucilaginibacter sp. PAMB04168 TaxID=3138567 RepID=UPI0031F6CE1B